MWNNSEPETTQPFLQLDATTQIARDINFFLLQFSQMRFCITFQKTKRREIERNGEKDDKNGERQDEGRPRSEKVYKLSTDIQAETQLFINVLILDTKTRNKHFGSNFAFKVCFIAVRLCLPS